MIVLFLLFLYFLAAVDFSTAIDVRPMSLFGNDMMAFASKEETAGDVDRYRVGCYLLYCHFDDKNLCAHSRKPGCDCRLQCKYFGYAYSRENLRSKTDTCAVWKTLQQCVDECILLLSKSDDSSEICSTVCGYHFSYADREEYQKRVCDTFKTWLPNSPLRLM
ncbi:hypothetical protein PRIPAC_84308 [Pristionchus pacificus]|uniref:Uncharacterized protein n=1 Tax=Pristionchus pacificus TaxID=54126 RepID=A0A454XW71_PRIPA|nr:hypothetical protein PRIPAC_84308 [Pristionchus pacificus]|eukprot:PDM68730.1 hypothetical protein PRIPAC_47032 [Pristionchus pacificus]